MNAFALLGLALLQVTERATNPVTDHAALHPPDAVFYVEVPDVSAAVDALDGMPLLALLRDPALGGLATSLMGDSFQLEQATVGAVWRLLGGPRAKSLIAATGAVSLSLVAPASRNLLLSSGGLDPASLGIRLVADFAEGPIAETVLQELQQRSVDERKLGDGSWQLRIAGWEEVPVQARVEGARLYVDLGQPGLVPVEEVDGTSWIRKGRSQLPSTRGVVLYDMTRALPVFDLVETILQLSGARLPAEVQKLPRSIDPFDRADVSRMQFVDGHLEVDTFVPDDAVVLRPESTALTPARFDSLPTDAVFAYVGSFDVGEALDTLRASTPPGNPLRNLIAGLEARGLDLDAVGAALGPELSVHSARPNGLSLPSTFAWVKVTDQKVLEASLKILVDELPRHLPGLTTGTREQEIVVAPGEKRKVSLTTFRMPPAQGETLSIAMFMEPTIALLDERLLVGLTSNEVKKELQRALGSDQSGGKLLERLQYSLEPRTVSFSTMDWAGLVGSVWDLVRSLGPMLAGMASVELPVDPSSLPPSTTFTRHFSPSLQVTRLADGGLLRHRRSSFGPETVLVPLATYLESAGVTPRRSPPAPRGEPVFPVGERGTTSRRLQRLYEDVLAYRDSLGTAPRTLRDLGAPTPRYPGGFLTLEQAALDEEGAPLDGWGRPFLYEASSDGASFRLWSAGPDGKDDGGDGDDVTGS